MQRIVLVFGLISGLIFTIMIIATIPLIMEGTMDFDQGEIIGYSSMFLGFLLVFFGIRSYRDNVNGGSITFGRAFKVGILITLVSSAVYVATWEIYYFNFDNRFMDKYAEMTIQKMRDRGATPAEIAAGEAKMAAFKRLYQNPLFNSGMTFLEVFPAGLIMTLISAGILRRKTPDRVAAEAAA